MKLLQFPLAGTRKIRLFMVSAEPLESSLTVFLERSQIFSTHSYSRISYSRIEARNEMPQFTAWTAVIFVSLGGVLTGYYNRLVWQSTVIVYSIRWRETMLEVINSSYVENSPIEIDKGPDILYKP